MTNIIQPIGPIRPIIFQPAAFLSDEWFGQMLLGGLLGYLIFLVTRIMFSRTPKYRKDDKNIPIYHFIAFAVMSSLLFVFGFNMTFIKGLVFLLVLLFASICDIQTHEVKDDVSVILFVTGLIGMTMEDIPINLISGIFMGFMLFVFAIVSRNRLGGADVKLSAACAFLLGFERALAGLIIGLFISVIFNLVIQKVKKTKDQPFPLAPYLSIGFMLMYFI